MNKVLGSILLAAGTAIGAGMLALPLVSVGMGFTISALLFVFIWAVMFQSGLLTLEVNLAFQAPRNSYSTMARETLGKVGQSITVIAFVLLLYSLTSAYIAGGSSLLEAAWILLFGKTFPTYVNALLFTIILGGIVAWSTRAVDILNRSLFSIKTLLLLIVFVLFVPQIDYVQLLEQQEVQYLWAAIPVILTAFGFHIVIPSLSPYLNKNVQQLKTVLFWGSFLPLIIYLLWLASLLGNLPLYGSNSFAQLIATNGSVGDLMIAINNHMQKPWLSGVLNTFANIALITSFLGVTLSLFDFLRDKEHKDIPHRSLSALYTFAPPLLVALFYPEGFIQLLSYASIFVAIILIILPTMMAYQLRRSTHLQSPYRAFGGTVMIVTIGLIGVLFVVIEILRILQLLPIWINN